MVIADSQYMYIHTQLYVTCECTPITCSKSTFFSRREHEVKGVRGEISEFLKVSRLNPGRKLIESIFLLAYKQQFIHILCFIPNQFNIIVVHGCVCVLGLGGLCRHNFEHYRTPEHRSIMEHNR